MATAAASAGGWISLLLLVFLPGALPWGKEGHYAICKIAEGLLSERARESVKKLLPDYAGGELSALCSWADEIRHQPRWRWTAPLHYIDTPDFLCNYVYSRNFIIIIIIIIIIVIIIIVIIIIAIIAIIILAGDCHDAAARRGRCVAGAIYNYSAQLSAGQNLSSGAAYNSTEALLFLSHFMGDIHQPLHVGFAGDEGGNTITVRWFRRRTNLHHVWDTMMIESALSKIYGSDLSDMIRTIAATYLVDPADISKWGNCASKETVCPNEHASESVRLACRYAYMNATPGATLGDEYLLSRLPLVEKRLAQAGARLAAALNSIFSLEQDAAGKDSGVNGASPHEKDLAFLCPSAETVSN